MAAGFHIMRLVSLIKNTPDQKGHCMSVGTDSLVVGTRLG